MATKVTTSSVLNPTLALSLISTPISLAAAATLFATNHAVSAALFLVVGVAPILLAGWQITYFTLKDPARLQREQHNENMLAIKHQIEIKDGGLITQVPISSALTGNPEVEDKLGE